jgi:hypothetical protein
VSAPLAGVLELNGLFLASGLALLWGLRGWRSWAELLETAGIAYLLGVCSVGVLATIVLVAGGGLPTVTIVLLCLAVAAAGAVLARFRRRPLPRALGRLPRLTPGLLVAAGLSLVVLTILVAFFRVARGVELLGGDSFEFWVPKAKVIYFFGRIDDPLFTSLANPRYPLFVPALQAMDFRLLGSAYAPELAVQYWFLYAGFAVAAAAILRRLAAPWLALLFVGLTGVIPELDGRMLGSQADWALDLQFGIAALLAVAWLRDREGWELASLGIVLAALIATKQEGLLLAGCLYAGLAAATLRAWRRTWPPLLATGVLAYLANLPWRIWWADHHIGASTGGFHDLWAHLSRGWPALRLVLRLQFDYHLWLAFVPLALVAAAAALTLSGRAREAATVYLVTAATAVAGFTYVTWSNVGWILDERQSSTPIPRAVGSVALLSTVVAPLLIEPLLQRRAALAEPAQRTAGSGE